MTRAIEDWAFSSALGTSGKEMIGFLAAREALRRAQARETGLAEALEQAGRLGLWARIYFIPDMCSILRGRPATDEAAVSRHILLDLIAGEESGLRTSLGRAVRDAGGASEGAELLSTVARAADQWLAAESFVSDILDYTDVEIFIAPTMILGLQAAISGEEALAGNSGTPEWVSGPLKQLLARALKGEYGRLPFLLATDLALNQGGPSDRKAVEDALSPLLDSASQREMVLLAPDILGRIARLRFDSPAQESPREKVNALARELTGLETYRGVFSGAWAHASGLTLWHDSIFHLMLDLDSKEAVRLLGKVWLPRIRNASEAGPVHVPLAAIPPDLPPLLKLVAYRQRRDSREPDLIADPSAEIGKSGLLLSPWPDSKRWTHANWAQVTTVERLRLLSGLSVGIRILETHGFSETLRPFALHLLASITPLWRYRHYDGSAPIVFDRGRPGRPWDDEDKKIRGAANLGWLARSLLESSMETLDGGARADLDSLVDLIEEACNEDFAFPGLPSTVDPNRAHHFGHAVANGALRLIEREMGTGSRSWEGGWMGAADRILHSHAPFMSDAGQALVGAAQRNLGTEEILHGLIGAYLPGLRTRHAIVDTRILDMISDSSVGKGWNVDHRRLLLAPVDDAARWIGPPDDVGSPKAGLALTRALIRVDSAFRDQSFDQPTAARWREDLKRRLGQITELVDFDQFVRLRLVDMIARGVFDGREAELLTAVTALVAFGQPLQIRVLIRALGQDRSGSGEIERVRLALHHALTGYLANHSEREALDAFRAKILLLRHLKATCLFAAGGKRTVASALLLDHRRADARRDGNGFVQKSIELISTDGGQLRVVPFSDPWIATGTAEMMLVETANGAAHMVQRARPSNALNAFARLSTETAGPHIGVVEHGADLSTAVRFTPDKVVTVLEPRVERSQFGDLVIVANADRAGPVFQQALSPRLLTPIDEAKGTTGTCRIEPEPRENQLARLVATIPNQRPCDLTEHSCNFAWLAQRQPPSFEIELVDFEPGSPLVPKMRDLADLFAEHSEHLANGGCLTLAVDETPAAARAGLREIVLEDRPLRRYRISMDFGMTESCREAVARELAKLNKARRNPWGLLISFRVVQTDLGPQLELAGEADRNPGDPAYPGLRMPFDDRNLSWRDRFASGAGMRQDVRGSSQTIAVLAQKIGPHLYSWQMEAEPGFPTQLLISVQDTPGRASDSFIELIPSSWNPWDGTIFGTVEQSTSLDLPPDDPDRAAAIYELDGLKPGAMLSLLPGGTIRDDGRVDCRTAIGVIVPVNAESISMKVPCKPKQHWPEDRKAVLTYVNWREAEPAVTLRAEEVPITALSGGRARGYFVRAPRELDNTAICEVAWLNSKGEGLIEREVTIAVPRQDSLWLSAGSRLDIELRGEVMTGKVSKPSFIADAVWRETVIDTGEEADEQYIGSLTVESEPVDLYEVGQGRFLTRPGAEGEVGTGRALQRFLALADEVDYVRTQDRASSLRRVKFTSAGRRCAFTLPEGTAAGVTATQVEAGNLRLTGLQLRRYPTPDEEGFILERRFQMLPERERSGAAQASDEAEDSPSDSTPRTLELGDEPQGRYDFKARRLRLHGELRLQFSAGIEIEPDRMQRAPLGPDESFPGGVARARIISTNPFRGSFVDTAPRSLGELSARLLAARTDDRSGALDPAELRLVFVGRKLERDEATGQDVTHYMFEWGYGLWLALPASRISYNGQSIATADIVLFFGDTISGAKIVNDEEGALLLITAITQSRAYDLYLSALNHEVINVLEVVVEEGRVGVSSIEGFDPGFWPGRTGPERARFIVPHAKLGDGESLLIERQAQAPKSSHTIFARLNTKVFKKSQGATLRFDHVRFDPEDREKGLRPGERIMVAAGMIVRTTNDYGLIIHDPGLDPDDVAPSFQEGSTDFEMIFRREFSLREQTLSDIFALDGPEALRGDRLMVRIGKRTNSLVKGSLERNPNIIRQLLRGGGELLAIFAGISSAQGRNLKLRFELQPGVIVALDPDQVDGFDKLLEGDTTRLRLAGAGERRLVAELALPSDLHFVRDGRPAIILARHTLAYRDAFPPYPDPFSRRAAMGRFSVGDLPGLTATAALTVDQFEKFMSQPHPKSGQLYLPGEDEKDKSRVPFRVGLPATMSLGKLRYRPARAGVAPSVFILQEGGQKLATDWYLLSYRDASAVEIEWQVSEFRWSFHENQTVTWRRREDRSISPQFADVPPVGATDGPLIFSLSDSGSAALRRPRTQLSSFAIGPTALLVPLNQARGKAAGVEVAVASADSEGLLVELSPGRLVRLPGGIAHRSGPVSIPLRTLDWEAFGPGDTLSIRAAARPSALSPVEFDISWTHGPRNGFGPRGAVLERDPSSEDASRGVALYGAGAVRIKVPAQNISKLPAKAIVGGDEALLPMPSAPGSLLNCTVLVTATEAGELAVHGLPGIRVCPSPGYAWGEDSFIGPALDRRREQLIFIEERVVERIHCAGGALPFTVEGQRKSTLLLSRRHQQFRPREGCFALAHPEGIIGTSGRMQLRVGARHLAIHGEALLRGVPRKVLASALAAVAAAARPVWIRTNGGVVGSGHKAMRMPAFTVTPVTTVGHEGQFLGVVCEGLGDGKLYWLPAIWAAACELTFDEARSLFMLPRLQRIAVCLQPDGAVSVLHHPRAVAELERLKLGAAIFVDVLRESRLSRSFWSGKHVADDWVPVVTQSKHTSVLFAAAVQRDMRLEAFQGEVAVRHDAAEGVKILLTPAGERLVATEVPAWVLGLEAPSWLPGDGFRYLELDASAGASTEFVPSLNPGPDFEIGCLEEARTAYLRAGTISLILGIALASATGSEDEVAAATASISQIHLLRNLFARALRSIPLEHLATFALQNPQEVSQLTPPWRDKLSHLLASGRLRDSQEAARRWLDVITLNEVCSREKALAHAYAAAVGVSCNSEILVQAACVLPRVISATRPVFLSRTPPPAIVETSVETLNLIAREIADEQYDIPLAAPILSLSAAAMPRAPRGA